MNTPNTVEDLFALYESKGDEHYGEFITQTEHALQCAALARRDGATTPTCDARKVKRLL